jgi:DNA-binding NtrC family response regulator
MKLFNTRFAKSLRFSDGALKSLLAYRWPGNVRQLINVVEQAAILTEGPVIEVSDLPSDMRRESRSSWAHHDSEIVPLHEVEKQYIEFVLEKMGGHRTKAAKALGISERNLYRKLKEFHED